MDNPFVIHLSGFFDGEGSIGIYKSKRVGDLKGESYYLSVSVAQKESEESRKILNYLLTNFNGFSGQ